MISLPALLSVLAGVSQSPLENASDKGTRLLESFYAKMKTTQYVEAALHYDAEISPGKFVHCRTRFKVAKSPYRHWSVLECDEPRVREMVVFDGKVEKTSIEGVAKQRDLSFPEAVRVVAGQSSSPAVGFLWSIFYDGRLEEAIKNRTVTYLLSEEIEGELCDLVQWTRTTQEETEQWVKTNLLWISSKSGLPRAVLSTNLGRGGLRKSSRMIFDSFVANPAWKDDPFAYIPKHTDSSGSLNTQVEKPKRPDVVGRPIPDLLLQDSELRPVSFRTVLKKPTLLTVWAPWCGPCQEEVQALSKSKLVGELGLEIIVIASSDTKDSIRKAFEQLPKGFTYLIDQDAESSSSRLLEKLGIQAFPTSFAVSTDGNVLETWVGFSGEKELEARLKKAFGKTSP